MEAAITERGYFTIGTREGDPRLPSDDYKVLLYGHPNPATSFTSVRIDGADSIVQQSSLTAGPAIAADSATTSWRIGGVDVTQVLSVVNGPVTGQPDTIRIAYTLRNPTNTAHSAGLRLMLDTMLGANDGAPFRVPSVGQVTTEMAFGTDSGRPIPDYFQAFDSLESPGVVSHASILDARLAVQPDRFLIAAWPQVRATTWDYQISPDRTILHDSAAVLYWDPMDLAPGQSRSYVMDYGISQLVQDLRPPLATAVSPLKRPLTPMDGVNGELGDPLAVYVGNNGGVAVHNARVRITLPAGLAFEDGSRSKTTDLGAVEPGSEASQVSLRVHATEIVVGSAKAYNYRVEISGDEATVKTIDLATTVPPSHDLDSKMRPNPDGYGFPNARDASGTDGWETWKLVLGNGPLSAFQYQADFWAQGNCHGFATSSLTFWYGKNRPRDVAGQRASTVNAIDAGKYERDVEKGMRPRDFDLAKLQPEALHVFIERYQLSQRLEACSRAEIGTGLFRGKSSTLAVYQAIKDSLSGSKRNLCVLSLDTCPSPTRQQGAGHSVVAYAIDKPGADGWARIWVYDNNWPYYPDHPNSSKKFVEVNVSSGQWRYQIFDEEVWDSEHGNLSCIRVSDLWTAMSKTPGGAGLSTKPAQVTGDPPAIAAMTVVYAAHASFATTSGLKLGFAADGFQDQIPGAKYLYSDPIAPAPEGEGYLVSPEAKVIRSITATATQAYRYTMLSSSGAAELNAVGTPGFADTPDVSRDLRSLSLTTAAADKKVASLEVLRKVGTELRVMSANETTLAAGERLRITASPRDDVFTVRNDGAPKRYRPVVAKYGRSDTFTAEPQLIESGQSDTVRVSDWNDIPNSRIELAVDRNSDGKPETIRVLQEGRSNSAVGVVLAVLGTMLIPGIAVLVVRSKKPTKQPSPDDGHGQGRDSGWGWLQSGAGGAGGAEADTPDGGSDAAVAAGAAITIGVAGEALAHIPAGQSVIIGRAEDAGVRLTDSKISARHASVTATRGESGLSLRVEDLGSSNGTFIGRKRIGPQGANWPAGSELRVGGTKLRWKA